MIRAQSFQICALKNKTNREVLYFKENVCLKKACFVESLTTSNVT